jgi:alpha-galactosidase
MSVDESAIHFFQSAANHPIWILRGQHTAYAFGLDTHGMLQHLYWGPKLLRDADYGEPGPFPGRSDRPEGASQEEFPAWGDLKFNEPCLKATFADGVRAVVLRYASYEIHEDNRLIVTLQDAFYPLTIQLHYRIVPEYDLIIRSATLTNTGDQPIRLERVMSAAWQFPMRDQYRLRTLNGEWGAEFQIQDTNVRMGKQLVERRRGARGHDAQPWFGLAADGATETSGEVWLGTLAYSSNFQLILEKTAAGQVTLTGGISDFDFTWQLAPGEKFTTPDFAGVYSDQGFGEASRLLHGYQLEYVLPKNFARQVRPVLYNSWYVTLFDVNVENQSRAADRAAELGVELFVMDDGWFGQRKTDRAGLGDWYVDPDKFPDGLKPLIDHVNALGMDFGIWVEPEMINPDSDLYRAHPDWVYHFPNRPRSEGRHQLVLNVARQDVQDFIFDFMDDLLSNNHITFIKWDMNRPFSEPGWPDAPAGRDREMWVRHARGVYAVLERLRAQHPGVMFESCSGGGGRVDLGIMPYVEQFWMSDNTDPFDQIFMTEGFSMGYALAARMSWVTDPIRINGHRQPTLDYTFHSAMLGAMGLGANLLEWTDAQMAQARDLITAYKEVRETIQMGRLYRLRSPRASELAAFQFVHPQGQEVVVFIFLHSSRYGPFRTWLRLQGLEESAIYHVEGHDNVSGQALMKRGILVEMAGDFTSQMIRVRRKN